MCPRTGWRAVGKIEPWMSSSLGGLFLVFSPPRPWGPPTYARVQKAPPQPSEGSNWLHRWVFRVNSMVFTAAVTNEHISHYKAGPTDYLTAPSLEVWVQHRPNWSLCFGFPKADINCEQGPVPFWSSDNEPTPRLARGGSRIQLLGTLRLTLVPCGLSGGPCCSGKLLLFPSCFPCAHPPPVQWGSWVPFMLWISSLTTPMLHVPGCSWRKISAFESLVGLDWTHLDFNPGNSLHLKIHNLNHICTVSFAMKCSVFTGPRDWSVDIFVGPFCPPKWSHNNNRCWQALIGLIMTMASIWGMSLYARHCDRSFTLIGSFNLHHKSTQWALLFFKKRKNEKAQHTWASCSGSLRK